MLSARSARITAGSGRVLSDAAGHADVRTGTLFLSITGWSQPLLWTRSRRNRSISSIRGAGSPGSRILSVGSFGCNLHCPFCQNHEIAEGTAKSTGAVRMSPEEILEAAVNLRSRGNIGVAFTYNEALVGYEFVRDTARLVHEAGMYNVLVTNGMAEIPILLELLPYIDAMNIDLKAFRPELYKWLGGDLQTVMRFISRAAEDAHVELTTLIIPGKNDDLQDMEEEAAWIAEIDPEIPLHITRYFPRHRMTEPPTDIRKMRILMSVAKKHLKNVVLGNV